ncbi:helix-turn-helix domain-containing protein [Edwardsiella tarda]|uniref:helix-turn-helix domain-containing protein n=1 Tax=Edwardsiella tarda TaxID=636 RepID=UPI002443ADB7|nr:helix-turn-helix domain-containing protein [Edwardsiella tarda]WGE30497.1 helix-turn-helix domain-containing protein [Edwardsiella tarda]
MYTPSSLSILKQIETLQLEALESCSDSAKKILLEIAIEKIQSITAIISNPLLYVPCDGCRPIGHRIQLARENLGLTEAELARQLNTYSDHVSDWEAGISELPASQVIPLANVLKCDPLWLLTGNIEVAQESCS